MAATNGKDFGAALSGLVLGGSAIFLLVLLVVWLTNSSFANKDGHAPAAHAPPAAAGAPATAVPGGVAPPASPAAASGAPGH